MIRTCSLLLFVFASTRAASAQTPVAIAPAAALSPCLSAPTCYQDCITHRCVLVPEMKQIKKSVYEVKDVPFCLKKLPPLCSLLHSRGCDDCRACAECDCPRYKRVLIKKEICEEICVMTCIPEEIIQRVPCRGCPSCQQP